jgi:hypothetical protein
VKFYLGTHHPHWLGTVDVPLFVSRRSLSDRKTLPRARAPWCLDSGGFSELSLHGRWTITPAAYVAEVRRFVAEVGNLVWAAPMDFMCEPDMLQRTGLSVAEHQRRTVQNFLELRALAPELPFIPVLQGWSLGDYLDCAEAYERAGVRLVDEPTVGLGTVCRRQNTGSASNLVAVLGAEGLRLHGFGFKATGLKAVGDKLASADSLAWSYQARRNPPLPECRGVHKNCANCPRYALDWREELLGGIERREREGRQLALAAGWT